MCDAAEWAEDLSCESLWAEARTPHGSKLQSKASTCRCSRSVWLTESSQTDRCLPVWAHTTQYTAPWLQLSITEGISPVRSTDRLPYRWYNQVLTDKYRTQLHPLLIPITFIFSNWCLLSPSVQFVTPTAFPLSLVNQIVPEPLNFCLFIKVVIVQKINVSSFLSMFQCSARSQQTQRDSPKHAWIDGKLEHEFIRRVMRGLWERGFRGFWNRCRRVASVSGGGGLWVKLSLLYIPPPLEWRVEEKCIWGGR